MRLRARLPVSAGRNRCPLRVVALLALLAAACAAPTPTARRPPSSPRAPTKPAPAPASRPAPPALPSLSPWYVMVPSLNVRRCPGVTCSRVAVLPLNEVVLRLREDGEWVEVRVVKTGETGWVAARFLGDRPVASAPKPSTPARPAPAETYKEEFLE